MHELLCKQQVGKLCYFCVPISGYFTKKQFMQKLKKKKLILNKQQ